MPSANLAFEYFKHFPCQTLSSKSAIAVFVVQRQCRQSFHKTGNKSQQSAILPRVIIYMEAQIQGKQIEI